MSGPITAGYFLAQGLLMLSARALREARAMHGEFTAVRDQLERREAELAQARRRQQDARLERMAALQQRAQAQRARLTRLSSLAAALEADAPALAAELAAIEVTGGIAGHAPAAGDDAAWSRYVQALDTAVRKVEALLATVQGQRAERVRGSIAGTHHVADIDEVLAAYALQRQLHPGLDAGQTERFRATAKRILDRLEPVADESLPPQLESLARAIVLAPTVERAEALASELRHAVQREREDRVARERERAEALRLLDGLPEDAPAPLLRALEAVAAGCERLDAALRGAVEGAMAQAAASQERVEQEAAALVLEESLRDLGYEVEGIEATLFATGGAAHFRRPGWDNYFVRLRVDPEEKTVNFNVVRARGDEEGEARRRLDALAEDRWCAEFPRLLNTLEARGLRLDVTRRLEAGELPVQVVDGAQLPRISTEEDGTTGANGVRAPRARPAA